MTVPLQWEICFKVLEQCHFDWESNDSVPENLKELVLEQCHFDWESNTFGQLQQGSMVLEQCHFDWESNAGS